MKLKDYLVALAFIVAVTVITYGGIRLHKLMIKQAVEEVFQEHMP